MNLGGTPRGLRHPQDAPLVDPSTLGAKTLYELAFLKYCYIVACTIKKGSMFERKGIRALYVKFGYFESGIRKLDERWSILGGQK